MDDKARKYIHFAVDGAQRMTSLIDELLIYARLGSKDTEDTEKIDLNLILEEVLTLAKATIEESGAVIQSDSLPIIHAEHTAIKLIFQNLIGNALKYQKPGNQPHISIGVKDKMSFWEFAVTDNGIGIPNDSKNNVFQLFKRLHSKDEYPGTGMGLSICSKIINNLGGEIWVESEEGKGATFYFSIPKINM